MIRYAVIDNGIIVGIGNCSDIVFERKLNAVIAPEHVNEDTHYFLNNEFIPFPSDKPSDDHVFDIDSNSWVIAISEQELTNRVLSEIRRQRSALLTVSDWTQTIDCPLDDIKKEEWKIYRQNLRDLPSLYENETDFNNVIWPTRP